MKTMQKIALGMLLGAMAMYCPGCHGGSTDDTPSTSTNAVTSSGSPDSNPGSNGGTHDGTSPVGNGSPSIKITSVPKMGQTGNVSGTVSGVVPNDYVVAVYIDVGGGWWVKPYDDDAATAIQSDGTWSANMTTGGDDQDASQVIVYLLPKSVSIPIILGGSSPPSSLDHYPLDTTNR